MNRMSNSTSTQKLYAQAAAQPKSKQVSQQHQNSHQNQQQQQQQQPHIQQTAATTPSNNSTSSVNGKLSTSHQKPQPQNNSVIGNGNANTNVGRSVPTIKATQQKNPVQLPTKGQPRENNAITIQFGSLNQPSTPSLSTSPVNNSIAVSSGGALPSIVPKINTVFGTVSVRGASEELAQPTPTPPAVVPSGPGAFTTTPRPVAARINEIPRTQSAPPQLNLQDSNNVSNNVKNVGQPSGHQSSNITSRTQPVQAAQQLSTATPHQQPISTSNTPHHRKDSVSSTVSSNDGQQNQHFHPHQPQPHHTNHNHTNQHAHSSYGSHHPHGPRPHPHHKPGGMPGSGQGVPGQYQRPRDNKTGLTGPVQPSPPINPAQPTVSQQGAIPQNAIPMQQPMLASYRNPTFIQQFYPYYPMMPTTYVSPVQRPPMPQQHIPQQTSVPHFTAPSGGPKSRAIPIINPADKTTVVVSAQPSVTAPNVKKEEALTTPANDVKKLDDVDKEKEKQLSDDKKESKAVKIVNPAEKDKLEREKKEKEEKEQREREEKERIEREEKERKEKEEMEQREREKERIRREQEEKERQEREEKERKEREEKEREEKERKELEEKERKEREEKERKEHEEKERKEREERERKEREERERKEQEEKERKEQEEKERKEQEERERKEREEKERKEQEELEKKKKEEEREQERIKREKEEREKKEREDLERIEKERKEQEENEKKKEEEKAKADAEEAERKKETELTDKKDLKKEEKKYGKGHRPGPLDLSRTTSAPAGPLSSARLIDDLNSVQYPPHIKSPNPTLNANSVPGKYKYDRTFLMQFMNVCKEKPENLPALDAIGMDEPKDDKKGARNLRQMRPSKSPSQSSPFTMGEFKTPPKSNSDDRFMASTVALNGRTSSGPSSGRSTLGPRTLSEGTLLPPIVGHSSQSSGRQSGGNRSMNRRPMRGGHQAMGQDQVTPLEPTEGRWIPGMTNPIPRGPDELIQIEVVQRKVKALLNKLTLEKFDPISDQIVDYANKSRFERDGRILKEVIRLIFEKSCDEPNFSQMYAQLCRKMMERIDTEIVDENVKNNDGKFVQGGTLFRKYLLNRCQEDFEKGWKVNVPVPSNEKGEPDLMSEEYYIAARAKRHGLGLIRFIGELFKLNMLTERIMHECVKKLLTVHGLPEEEEMESLCKLMTTVGQQLDHVKAKSHMDTYFLRMEDMSKNLKLSSRIRFMIMDVIDLRNNNWVPRRDNNAPKTIAEIHEDAAKQKEEAEILRRAASSGGRGMPKMVDQMSRGGSGRRDKNMSSHGSSGQSVSSDGWSMVGGPSSASRQAGDLSKFGLVSRSKVSSDHVSLAPRGTAFASLAGGSKGWKTTDIKEGGRKDKPEIMSRANSTSNTYDVLAHSESTEIRKFDSSASESVKPFTSPPERKKIVLAPRSTSLPLSENPSATKSIMTKSSATSISTMSEDFAKRKINNMAEEYFNIGDVNEVILCIKELPKEFYSKAIETFACKALEKKQGDVDKIIRLFDNFIIEDIVDKSVFMRGFAATVEFLIDIGADAPKSYTFTGQLFCGARLDSKDVSDLLKPLSDIDDKDREKVMDGYLNALKADSVS